MNKISSLYRESQYHKRALHSHCTVRSSDKSALMNVETPLVARTLNRESDKMDARGIEASEKDASSLSTGRQQRQGILIMLEVG